MVHNSSYDECSRRQADKGKSNQSYYVEHMWLVLEQWGGGRRDTFLRGLPKCGFDIF